MRIRLASFDERFPQHIVRFVDGFPSVMMGEGRPLAHVHINKTAGTSFTQYLMAHFEREEVVAPPYMGEINHLPLQEKSYELFWGHFTFAQFYARRKDAWFITFLRDPVQRVISQYRSLHNPANLSGPWQEVLPDFAVEALTFAQRANLDEFVHTDNPFLLGHIDNLQTRFLSSFDDPRHPQFLASALHNLEKQFVFFGFCEEFTASIRLFQYQFLSNIDFEPERHTKNVSPPVPLIVHPRTYERIHELVEKDQMLYDQAWQVFSSRVRWIREQHMGQRLRRAA